jgi:ABC-type uncharacterized transport system substrate-binding protein
MSYASDYLALTRQARYVDKILKGAKPADLRSLSDQVQLIINLKTAGHSASTCARCSRADG